MQQILSLHHPKVFQRSHNRLFFFSWTLWLSGIFRFRQVIICPLNNATFLLYLCNIQVADFQSALLQNVIFDFLISCFALGSRQIKLVHLKFYLDMFICMEFGKQHDTFHMAREDRKYVKSPLTPSNLIHRCFYPLGRNGKHINLFSPCILIYLFHKIHKFQCFFFCCYISLMHNFISK